MRKYIFIGIYLLGLFGCNPSVERRQYTEASSHDQKPVQSVTEDPHAFLADDPHAFLGEDPHAFMGGIPNDDVHANVDMKEMLMMQMDTSAGSPLNWSVPDGWVEQKKGGMRLATFVNTDENDPVETSVISLTGEAGGLAGNVIRWMQQINLDPPAAADLNDFLNRQERFEIDGRPVVFIDLTQWQTHLPAQTPSVMAAIIDGTDSKIFIKMNGSKKAVLENQPRLKALVQSIGFND